MSTAVTVPGTSSAPAANASTFGFIAATIASRLPRPMAFAMSSSTSCMNFHSAFCMWMVAFGNASAPWASTSPPT